MWLQSHVSPGIAKERLLENSLDSFKKMDDAPSNPLDVSGDDSSHRLGIDSKGSSAEGNHHLNLTAVCDG